jgi:hypothetical protein
VRQCSRTDLTSLISTERTAIGIVLGFVALHAKCDRARECQWFALDKCQCELAVSVSGPGRPAGGKTGLKSGLAAVVVRATVRAVCLAFAHALRRAVSPPR